jgi:hypothetical protein
MPRAGAIEIKARTQSLLDDISKSVRRIDPDYLVGAWNAAVNAMEAHPDHAQSFALAAAISLAQLDRPSQPGLDHEHHAVMVTESATLHAATINTYWGSHPPVSELQLIEVPGLVEFIARRPRSSATPIPPDRHRPTLPGWESPPVSRPLCRSPLPATPPQLRVGWPA